MNCRLRIIAAILVATAFGYNLHYLFPHAIRAVSNGSVENVSSIFRIFIQNGYIILPAYAPADGSYVLFSEKMLKIILSQECYANYRYYEDFFDCDDYSLLALAELRRKYPGIACFMAGVPRGTGRHAMIVCASQEGKLLFYDPQTCTFEKVKSKQIEVFG